MLSPNDWKALKENYVGQNLEVELYDNFPALQAVKNRTHTNFEGKYRPYPVEFTPAGAFDGATDSYTDMLLRARANQDNEVSFLVNMYSLHGASEIPGYLRAQSRTKAGSFIDIVKKRLDDGIALMMQGFAPMLWKSGFGDIGIVAYGNAVTGSAANTLGAGTFALQNPSDVANISVGQYLDFAADQSTSAIRARGTANPLGLRVTGTDLSAGTVTVAGNIADAVTGTPGVSAGDYVFRAGNRQVAVAGGIVPNIFIGFEGWCPVSLAANDNFLSVNRNKARSQLAGTSYQQVPGVSIEQTIINALTTCQAAGGRPDEVYVNFQTWGEIQASMQQRVQYTERSIIEKPYFGVRRGIVLAGPAGEVTVVADPTVPSNRIYGWSTNSAELLMSGDGWEVDDSDGNFWLRAPDADSNVIRWNMYGNFACRRPVDLLNIQITPVGQ